MHLHWMTRETIEVTSRILLAVELRARVGHRYLLPIDMGACFCTNSYQRRAAPIGHTGKLCRAQTEALALRRKIWL
jgi:hypothetical protein